MPPMIRNSQKFKVLSSKKRRKSDKDIRIIFPESLYRRMRASFDEAEAVAKEGYAIAQCGYKSDNAKAAHARKSCQYLVKSIHVPAQADLFEQSSITVTPGAEFLEGILSEASEHDSTILEIHTHVDSATPNFSWVDIENGIENGRFLKSCGLKFAMVVMGTDGFSMSEYEADHDAMQAPASARISLATRVGLKGAIRPKLAAGQFPEHSGVGDLRIAIVGINGVGSKIAHKLAGMGVCKFILFDDRLVDGSEPMPDALAKDLGKKRTKVLHRSLKKISKDIDITHVNHDIGEDLRDCDAIFGCDGRHERRLAMNMMSLKYFIPFIDVSAGGEVRVIMPSANGCLGCLCDLPPTGSISVSEKIADTDSFIASMAVQELIDILNGVDPKTFDHIKYSIAEQSIGLKPVKRDEWCPLCGKGGILGAGDEKKKRF